MSTKALVIVNPASGGGSTGRHWPELRAALDRVLTRWDSQFTAGPGDATRIVRRAIEDGYEMIVGVGGDGTMSEIANGLFPEGPETPSAPTRRDLIIAPVRRGTGGDFARMFDLSGSIPACVAHLAGPSTQTSDVGLVEYEATNGGRAWRAFINIASFGLSGVIDEKVNRSTKAFGGRVSFFVGLMGALVQFSPQHVEILVDGEPFLDEPMIACAIANGRFFGGGMKIAAQARIDDGLLEVVAVLRAGAKEVLSIADLYSGALTQWQSVRERKGRVVEARPKARSRVLLDVDGEQPGVLPARFSIVPGAVRLKVVAG